MHRDPRAGLTCICYGACVTTPAVGLFSGLKTQKVGSEGTYSARCAHLLPYRRCSGESGVPGGREHVGLLWVRRVAEPGRNQDGPLPRTNIMTPSSQNVASLRCESWVRLGPRRSPSLLRPFASLFPRTLGYAAAHRTPDSLAALSRLQKLRLLCLLSNSAGQQLASFVSAGQCPRRLPSPVQGRTPLSQVPPDSVQGRGRRAWELRDPLGSLGRRICWGGAEGRG